ncbi:hypothetical protein [Frigoribacterium sp. SL97]|uniref:hypothetical protein n=1 Tax=Frigoribacterium sp. SL97 TaxID=2994664 RepID=UPI0022705E98|nr:hypothetical protein [Frigoribacterium sp. SL97]WAC50309.1 hypothetical protein OVA02_10440 [Frigoribacterium sp. SL97]
MTRIPRTVLPFSGPLPYPAAHVLRGSEVERSFLGFTRAHAVGRAFLWARRQDDQDRQTQRQAEGERQAPHRVPKSVALPAMAATREAAVDMALGWGSDLSGLRAVIYCAPMTAGSDAFCDEVVLQVLDRRADGIELVGASVATWTHMVKAGRRNDFEDIRMRRAVDV